ncbi:MAG TPA: flagellar hook-associated protein FlgL [Solirubrobacteraceae bacterium]|nr:flagellar hook-associated protein FlgL [Solirubrobacteraceae bacterium]
MRVAFLSLQQNFVDAVGRRQSEMARLQEQVATGRKFTRPGQDPAGAARVLGIDTALGANAQYVRNIGLATGRLNIEESVLADAGDVLQRLRELALQAANGPLSAENRASIAAEARERRAELLALANTRDGSGEYLFSGHSTGTMPFADAGGGVAYRGDQGRREVQIGADRFVADGDDGESVFMRVPDGNGRYRVTAAGTNAGTLLLGDRSVTDPSQYDGGAYAIVFTAPDAWEVRDAASAVVAAGSYAPGAAIAFRGLSVVVSGEAVAGDRFDVAASGERSVFATADALLAALESPDGDATARVALSNDLSNVLLDLDQASGRLSDARSGVGARLSVLESQQDLLGVAEIELKRVRSEVLDTDYADALTRLQQQLTSLEAAQQAFARTAQLSIFDYL